LVSLPPSRRLTRRNHFNINKSTIVQNTLTRCCDISAGISFYRKFRKRDGSARNNIKRLGFPPSLDLAIDLHLAMAAVRKAALGRDVKPEK
jgi:hypothetical protein